ncbi:hypothetical protein P5W99_36970 [Paraburkholderia sp. A3BS-1L]|uniref:hypothetical protein n=1 Tax=Paraburkholderia sp. A3BS-1L TaxID=3028375 RepID=UPI003DA9466A
MSVTSDGGIVMVDPLTDMMQRERNKAAVAANADDASIWRWLSDLLEERRIKWRYSFDTWIVIVDRKQLAAERSFDRAIRVAKVAAEKSRTPIG